MLQSQQKNENLHKKLLKSLKRCQKRIKLSVKIKKIIILKKQKNYLEPYLRIKCGHGPPNSESHVKC